VCKTGHQLFLTVLPTSINIPSEYKMSTEKGYPLEEQPKQSPYAALAFAAASFAGVMSIGIINLKTSRFFFEEYSSTLVRILVRGFDVFVARARALTRTPSTTI